MTVINRNDLESNLDIHQIREAIKWACKDLSVNYLELESHIDSIYTDKITTSQIQYSLIEIAAQLTSAENPEWKFVAGRLLLMEHYKNAAHHRGYSEFGYFEYVEFLKDACGKGYYDSNLLTLYSEKDLKKAAGYLNAEYDRSFDYAGIKMLINRYLITNDGKAYELPQEMFLTIALWLAANENKKVRLKYVEIFYNLIASRKVSLATPILLNLRRSNGNLSSCFIAAADDSLDNIFYNVNTIAQVSKNGGGIGLNMSRIRSHGAKIQGVSGASGGVIPWIKIVNDTAVAVNQLGKRAGAVTVALDVWHKDIEVFLELQTENGDQRKKAYDIFPQVVVPDLFMQRVKENEKWTLLDPHEVRQKYNIELSELWGEKFENFYQELENDEELSLNKTINARALFKMLLKSTIETGMPYIFFKDTANYANPNKHDGMIGNGNLCQESFSNFRPTKVGKPELNAEKVMQFSDTGLIHTCNLVSLNLSMLLTDNDLEVAAKYAVRILDNTIDLTITPIEESNFHNSRYRTIGIGAMGLADYLAFHEQQYEKSNELVNELFENLACSVIEASISLARERGSFFAYAGSDWNKGIFFGRDKTEILDNTKHPVRWQNIINDLKKYGIRNSQLLAIAPNTSSALLQGCSPSVLPVFSKFYIDKSSQGAVPVCPPFIKDSFWFYKENKHIEQKNVIEIISTIQKWIDQGISFELLYNLNNDIKAKDIYDTVMTAWQKRCKTIYYTRTIQKSGSSAQVNEECIACAN
jgi:ribonucleoside-diphosphate reductase alpha chain